MITITGLREKLQQRDLYSFFVAIVLASFGLLGFTPPLKASDVSGKGVERGWNAYIGCWQPQSKGEVKGMVCFIPTDDPDSTDVEMLTISHNTVTHRKVFHTDDTERDIEGVEKCHGTESARFSKDWHRLYVSSNISCEGEPLRESKGVMSMPTREEWVDVRMMEIGGRTIPWSQWYKRTDNRILKELQLTDTIQLDSYLNRSVDLIGYPTISEVIDVVKNTHPKVAEGWIAEIRAPFYGLNSKHIIRLDDAGVPGFVVDAVVAVSFPEKFAFEDEGRRGVSQRPVSPIYQQPYRYYGPYDYYRPGYYDFYGYYHKYHYGYGGYYDWRHYGGYVPVLIRFNRVRRPHGRIISPRGYRRGREYETYTPSRRRGVGSKNPDSATRPPTPRKASPRKGGSVGTGSKPRKSGGSRSGKAKRPRGAKLDKQHTKTP